MRSREKYDYRPNALHPQGRRDRDKTRRAPCRKPGNNKKNDSQGFSLFFFFEKFQSFAGTHKKKPAGQQPKKAASWCLISHHQKQS